jgi:hypothetical protein
LKTDAETAMEKNWLLGLKKRFTLPIHPKREKVKKKAENGKTVFCTLPVDNFLTEKFF